MRILRYLERGTLRLASGAVNASGQLLLQRMPHTFTQRRVRFRQLRRTWTVGGPKDNDLDLVRLAFLVSNVEAIEHAKIPGAFAELGVWRGHSAKVIHEIAPEREFYLFDTFAGFNAGDIAAETDVRGIGDHFRDSHLEAVRTFFGSAPTLYFIVGHFPDSVVSVRSDVRFAFVHLDCDLYEPMRAALSHFYPRMARKGLIIVHDYASGRWPGVTRAVDEFLIDKPEMAVVIPDLSGSAAIACRGAV